MLFFDVITLTVAGLLVGNELAIAVFVHPILYRLPDSMHLAVAPPLAKLLGRMMPFWYALAALLTAGETLVRHHLASGWSALLVSSSALWVLTILYTLAFLVPVNNRIAAWTAQTAPADWKRFRSKWDQLHRWRVVLLTAAFILLALGILQAGA